MKINSNVDIQKIQKPTLFYYLEDMEIKIWTIRLLFQSRAME
jgi:hypothetical protein